NERLADKYNLIYLSTSKKLVTQQQEKGILNENTHVALFGGINYEWNSNQQQRLQQNAISDIVASGAGFVPFEKQRNETFDSLPGSRAEVRAIDELCHLHKIKNDLFTDDLATEAQFKSLSGKIAPSILHVASHGFFIPDTNGKSGKDLYRNSKIPGYIYAKDPLLRSGLALAGVRRAWFGGDIPEGMENGILQAKEVSNMDLRNTKLVVLSACETGLGDVKGSEGVFGLQRSFKMAGADYLLMSLWKVPDEATQKLMTMFYENLFSGQPIREAFKNAQTRLRHLNIEYESPYYWGAWVLME
ncbi:MAG: CHAT domain-containing protein, partial [Bacteroidetes bacterium]|nr:CHAT domain-containing protein [Bacteroidota bacterium]